jgi:hypothetical protein
LRSLVGAVTMAPTSTPHRREITMPKRATAVRALTVIAALLVLAPPRPPDALAWGERGHVIVAQLAGRLLTGSARHAAARLLGEGESLESVAVWADGLRGSFQAPGPRPETPRWHFVDIPLHREYDAARDCPDTPNGSCVVSALVMFQDVLAGKRAGYYANSRSEALKFIVHFAGDIHQPLHCVDDEDAGGNLKMVVWIDGQIRRLHGVWDDAILSESMKRLGLADPAAYAARLFAELTPQQRREATPPPASAPTVVARGAIESWAKDAHALARAAYADLGPRDADDRYRLDATYYDRHAPRVDDQLKRAGIRLARILNENLR